MGGSSEDTDIRIREATGGCHQLSKVWESVNLGIKLKIFKSNVTLVLLHSSKTYRKPHKLSGLDTAA